MAEYVGIEPTHPLLNDRLAICCLNRSANTPLFLLILLSYVLIYASSIVYHAKLE